MEPLLCLSSQNQSGYTHITNGEANIMQTDRKEISSKIQNFSLCIKTLDSEKVRIYKFHIQNCVNSGLTLL